MLSWHCCGFVLATVVLISPARISAYKCTKLRETRCRNLGYNRTIEPNMFGHRDKKTASLYLNELQPLINVGCFSHMTAFLCSVLFPICTNWKERVKPIPPCRSLCLDAKAGCEGILNRFGYKWPKDFDCTRFPLSTANELCIYKNETTTQAKTVRPSVPIKQLRKICWGNSNKRCCRQGNRAAKIRSGTCSMPKLVAKHWSRKKKKSAKKTNKMCSKGVSKACYKACCEYKKKQHKNKARKSRKRRP